MTYRLGFDIGGTFTDLMMVDQSTGEVYQEKVPTTPEDFSRGAMTGIRKICEKNDVDPNEIDYISHGTTVATNALLEQEGVEVGLITTEGFRDILAIGREKRTDLYNYSATKNPTFAERKNRVGVTERVSETGDVLTPLDEEAVIDALDRFAENGVESVAVSTLHSFRNPAHEERIGDIVARESDLPYSLSSRVMPEIKEYERTLSTVINAYVGPLTEEYIHELEDALAELGIDPTLRLMHAGGGVITSENLNQRFLRLINSGPAAGVVGAKRAAQLSDIDNIITLDMGGTSADACVIYEGTPERTTEGEINDIPLLFPQVDVRTVGAGGGSIAWIDRMGVLKVGPKSASAVPGPACYGRGGTEPTVTDAALLLGYLNDEYFLGGDMSLDADAAREAVETLSDELDREAVDIADGVLEIVTTNMTRMLRLITVEKGYDPRKFSLTCYGGAGPMFATRLARELGTRRALVPAVPGVLSASGLLATDEQLDFSNSNPKVVAETDVDEVRDIYEALETRARETAGDDFDISRSVDMRYVGQRSQLNIQMPDGDLTAETLAETGQRFEDEYEATYGHLNPDTPLEVVTWRLQATRETETLNTRIDAGDADLDDAIKGTREAYGVDGFTEFTVYDRYKLPAGSTFEGPAIVEETESSTVVDDHSTVETDDHGNLVITLPE